MPGLVPGIHVLQQMSREDVDGRDKPGHDGNCVKAERQNKRPKLRLTFLARLSG